jgi:hypothetical protein
LGKRGEADGSGADQKNLLQHYLSPVSAAGLHPFAIRRLF